MTTFFDDVTESESLNEHLGPGIAILLDMAKDRETEIMHALFSVAIRSPFCHMVTPGDFRMSVAMTNCG
jgi:DNA oxidative demethylase